MYGRKLFRNLVIAVGAIMAIVYSYEIGVGCTLDCKAIKCRLRLDVFPNQCKKYIPYHALAVGSIYVTANEGARITDAPGTYSTQICYECPDLCPNDPGGLIMHEATCGATCDAAIPGATRYKCQNTPIPLPTGP